MGYTRIETYTGESTRVTDDPMLRKKYKTLVHTQYRPMDRKDISGAGQLCLWCGVGRNTRSLLWCSEECQSQYLARANQQDLRRLCQERDVNLCEVCGKFDPHYAVSPRLPAEHGGGAAGLDGVRTLCEQCFLESMDFLTPEEVKNPPIPDVMKLRRAWRATDRRWRSLRYTLGPVIVSGIRWTRILDDYKKGGHHLAKAAAYRTRDHFRLIQVTKRWWKIVRKNSKNPHPLLQLTIDSLEEQHRCCAIWAIYFRERGQGALD